MGEIIINIPQSVKRTYDVTDPQVADEIIANLDELTEDTEVEANPDRVLGMWKDRFGDEASEEVARRWRREFWQRS